MRQVQMEVTAIVRVPDLGSYYRLKNGASKPYWTRATAIRDGAYTLLADLKLPSNSVTEELVNTFNVPVWVK